MLESPCGWTPDLSACRTGPCCPDITGDENETIRELALSIASGILWRLTGMRFGCCEVTVRPCKPETCAPQTVNDIIYWDQRLNGMGNLGVSHGTTPLLIDGAMYNISCGCPSGCCTCKADCEFPLPGPVCSIKDIVVGDIHLGLNMYSVYDSRRVVFRNVGVQAVIQTDTVPLPAEITQVTAFPLTPSGCGVSLDSVGSGYQFELTIGNQQDVQFVVEIPVGNFATELSFFQPQGFDWIVLDGGNPTITHPTNSKIIVGPATIPDTNVRLLIRAPRGDTSGVRSIVIQQDGPGNPVRLCEVQYSDYSLGEGYCPPCQDYNKPLGEDGTWGVTYSIGTPVPPELEFAAGILACEIAKSMVGDASCGLPSRVQHVTRQGVDIDMFDPIAFANAGLTGLPIVDTIIRALNPRQLAQQSTVWYPGSHNVRRET